MDPEFIAGVTGALVGGAIGYVLQRQAFAKEAAQRTADRKEAAVQSDERRRIRRCQAFNCGPVM